MEEIRGSPARRLSQILDPIARLATDFGSNSAPCSPRLGARGYEPVAGSPAPSTPEGIRRQPIVAAGADHHHHHHHHHHHRGLGAPSGGGGADSPRLWPRQFRQAPTPPPRPRHGANGGSTSSSSNNNNNNNNSSSPVTGGATNPIVVASGSSSVTGGNHVVVHTRDSPYVNVPNLLYHQKDKTGGYHELASNNSSSGSSSSREQQQQQQPQQPKPKCSPYDFTSESSGQVEYADKRTFAAQTDFANVGTTCYDACKDLTTGLVRASRPSFDSGPTSSNRSPHFDRAYSFGNARQAEQQHHHQQQPNRGVFVENRLFLDQRNVFTVPSATSIPPTTTTTAATSYPENKKENKLESSSTRPTYGASKSFDGYSTAVEELNWQERCLELQLELHRSRSQATRVRDMLREKIMKP